MKLTPLADRVILKMVETEETTKGGIILTGSAKEKPSVAEVISVGPGGNVDGKDVVMTVKVGDKVITSQYAGTKVTLEDVEYVVVRQNDILAIVECFDGEQATPLQHEDYRSRWDRQSCRCLEGSSLIPPQAALRCFPLKLRHQCRRSLVNAAPAPYHRVCRGLFLLAEAGSMYFRHVQKVNCRKAASEVPRRE